MKTSTNPGIFDRIFEAAECRSQIELAELLQVKQAVVSDFRRRGTVPVEWLFTLERLKGVNPAWLATGEGPRYKRGEKDANQ